MHKYKVGPVEKRTAPNGLVFASENEMKRYLFLKKKEEDGEIFDLALQPRYRLKGPDGSVVCDYIADFKYIEGSRLVVEDYKGAITPEFRLKRRLWASNFPDQPLSVIGWDPLKAHRCFRAFDDIKKDQQARRRLRKKAKAKEAKNGEQRICPAS